MLWLPSGHVCQLRCLLHADAMSLVAKTLSSLLVSVGAVDVRKYCCRECFQVVRGPEKSGLREVERKPQMATKDIDGPCLDIELPVRERNRQGDWHRIIICCTCMGMAIDSYTKRRVGCVLATSSRKYCFFLLVYIYKNNQKIVI